MNKGICIFTYIPVRKEPSEASEMVSQILFGETYKILEQNQKWQYIELDFDGYKGWIDYKLSYIIDNQKLSWIAGFKNVTVNIPICKARETNKSGLFHILAGSNIYDLHGKNFSLFGISYQLEELLLTGKQSNINKVIDSASKLFINTPYLWGGRSAFGIDCSGFVQTVFKIVGINLPRDANQQVTRGIEVNSLSDTIPGDVAFFKNEEGKIVHTGILVSGNEIIHSSGYVHIAPIDEKGILNSETQIYTHELAVVKRMI
jgi:hypothetical protein